MHYRASAPGSLMLSGEHAVLHGRHSMVCAVNHRLQIVATPRADRRLCLRSSIGDYDAALDELPFDPAFRFVLAAIRPYAEVMPGSDWDIRSDFPPTIGFGSSAAVTVCSVALGRLLTGAPLDRLGIFRESQGAVRAAQGGRGSGADVAASVFGGTLLFRSDPERLVPVPGAPQLTAVYSGAKKPTPEVIGLVEDLRRHLPELFERLFDAMDQVSLDLSDAWRAGDWSRAGRLLDAGQGLMEAIGVSNGILAEAVHRLRKQPGVRGAKISGSGLGDCVVALGRPLHFDWPHEVFPVDVAEQGLVVETEGQPVL